MSQDSKVSAAEQARQAAEREQRAAAIIRAYKLLGYDTAHADTWRTGIVLHLDAAEHLLERLRTAERQAQQGKEARGGTRRT